MLEPEEKAQLKKALADPTIHFSKEELQAIIDHEFFDDDNPMDTDLIGAASDRLAVFNGIDSEEQYKETAYGVLKQFLDSILKGDSHDE